MDVPIRTIYDIIIRVNNNLTLNRMVGQGRKVLKMIYKRREQQIVRVDGEKGKSQFELANKLKITQKYVNKILRQNIIQYNKRETKTKVCEKQKKRLLKKY